jgi:hypothetical protein
MAKNQEDSNVTTESRLRDLFFYGVRILLPEVEKWAHHKRKKRG